VGNSLSKGFFPKVATCLYAGEEREEREGVLLEAVERVLEMIQKRDYYGGFNQEGAYIFSGERGKWLSGTNVIFQGKVGGGFVGWGLLGWGGGG